MYKYYKELLFLEKQPREYIEKYKKDELEKILIYAYHNVPYYTKILEPLFKNGKINLQNFNKIPLLTKDILRREYDNLISKDYPKDKTYVETSGGSTGEPIKILHDRDFWNKNMAIKLYYNKILGKEFGDKELKLWGSERDILNGSIGIKSKIDNFLYNRILLNSFNMSPERMKIYVKQWNSFKPKSVWSYVDSINEFAKYVEKNNIKIYSPSFVLVTAGTLYEHVREYVERVLDTKVFNQYGSREVGDMACECPSQEGLHLMEFSHFVEILDKKGNSVNPGQMGEVVVTLLTNYSMPLIRYRIGDTAILSKKDPKCGLTYKLLSKVTGRVTDNFVKKDGTIVHGEYFTHLFYHKYWVKKFQVVQKDYNLIECKVVLQDKPVDQEIKSMKRDIQKIMGKNCIVKFKFLDKIPVLKSGKYLYTISEIV